MSNFEVLEALKPSKRKKKEQDFHDEEILEIDEVFKVLPSSERGSLYFAYAMTNDNVMGVKDRYGNHFRLPHINHREFLAKICGGVRTPILVMSEGAYESFLNDNYSDLPGTSLVVVTKSKEYHDHNITIIPTLEELKRHILAATAIGQSVILNAGPKTLSFFDDIAKGEFILYHQKSAKDFGIRQGDKLTSFVNERNATDNSRVIYYRKPIPNVTKTLATLVYREFTDFTKNDKTLVS